MKLWPWRVQIGPDALRHAADHLEAEAAKLLPREHWWEREPVREPYRTTAWVDKPREIEA